ncbi:hypothetical protein RUM44_004361 [Polyplax serrata]|uniref:Uncharacterized protein n=1 Tax=Polyplax serrata TaxID=468196 RepID=A0ABR1B2M2_POLSC
MHTNRIAFTGCTMTDEEDAQHFRFSTTHISRCHNDRYLQFGCPALQVPTAPQQHLLDASNRKNSYFDKVTSTTFAGDIRLNLPFTFYCSTYIEIDLIWHNPTKQARFVVA